MVEMSFAAVQRKARDERMRDVFGCDEPVASASRSATVSRRSARSAGMCCGAQR